MMNKLSNFVSQQNNENNLDADSQSSIINTVTVSEIQLNTEEKRNRATKNWRKIKEISKKEDKRPPWQMVSLSTLPKADTNSILRAKLLDASRRLRAGKNSVAIQTEMGTFITKLMKEVNTDVQCDLISRQDAEVLTDGAICVRPEGPGEFFLTHSVSQMTEDPLITHIATQTPLPKLPSNFFHEYFNSTACKNLRDEIKSKQETDFISTDTEKISIENAFGYQKTLSYWSYDDDYYTNIRTEKAQKAITKIDNNLNNLLIDRKLSNMRLIPIPWKKFNMKNSSLSTISYNNEQYIAIMNLIKEANKLLQVFEDISIALGPDIQFSKLPKLEKSELPLPAKYWNPIMEKSRNLIAKKKSMLKEINIKTVEKLNLDTENL